MPAEVTQARLVPCGIPRLGSVLVGRARLRRRAAGTPRATQGGVADVSGWLLLRPPALPNRPCRAPSGDGQWGRISVTVHGPDPSRGRRPMIVTLRSSTRKSAATAGGTEKRWPP